MGAIDEADVWKMKPESVRFGEVIRRSTGKPLPPKVLIQRFWGWPQGAAQEAADRLEEWGVVQLWLSGDEATAQQERLLEDEAVRARLVIGLRRGASRESKSTGLVEQIKINFLKFDPDRISPRVCDFVAIRDHGLVTAIAQAIANRLGVVSLEDLRECSRITHGNGVVAIDVDGWVLDGE